MSTEASESAIQLTTQEGNETESNPISSTTSAILALFNEGLTKLKYTAIAVCMVHVLTACIIIWIVATVFSLTLTAMCILSLTTAFASGCKVLWVFRGTGNGAVEPDYAWLTKGFMWSVTDLFIGNFALCPSFVLYVCHSAGTHFVDIMFTAEENWLKYHPLLFACVIVHFLVGIFMLVSDCLSISRISSSILEGLKSDENEDVDDEDDEDDENALGPVTEKDKMIGCIAIFSDFTLVADFMLLAITADEAHSGLIVFTLFVVCLLIYRVHIVRKCYLKPKTLSEELLVNYRIFCIAHCVVLLTILWMEIQLLVTIVAFNETSFWKFMFSLKQPAQTQVIFLGLLFLVGGAIYAYLIYLYQKSMWLADKIASEKLADMLIAEEEDDDDDDDDEDEDNEDDHKD